MKNSHVIVVLLCMMVLQGCGQSSMKTYWSPINKEADAAVDSLESICRNEFTKGNLEDMDKYIKIIEASGNDNELKARANLYRAVKSDILQRPTAETAKFIEKALEYCDSVKYPYDRARISMMRDNYDVSTAQIIREASSAASVFMSVGDSMSYGIALSRVHTVLQSIGDTTQLTRRIANRCEQIFSARNYSAGLFYFKYNRFVNDYVIPMDTVGGVALADSLMRMKYFKKADWQRSVVYLYKWDCTHDLDYLKRAYQVSDKYNDAGNTQTLSAGELAKYFSRAGQTDSAKYYFDIFRKHLHEPFPASERVFPMALELYPMLGMRDSVPKYENLYDTYLMRRDGMAFGSFIHSVYTNDILAALEAHYESPKKITFISIISIAILIYLFISAIIALRRKRKNDAIDTTAIDNIRAQIGADAGWQDVERAFAQYAPRFEDVLKSKYPKISAAEIRIAYAVIIGISSKQLAQMLNIEPESVKKGRQRLRTRLELESANDLAPFLNSLISKS